MSEKARSVEIIVCPVTRWYRRRTALMAALFAGLALSFLYDGLIGYPKINFQAALFDAFEVGKNGGDAETFFTGDPDSEIWAGDRAELSAAFETGVGGGSWAVFAAERHLGEAKPKRHSRGTIRQQIVFGWILGILATFTIGVALFQGRRCLRAGPDWLETPAGRRIEFSRISGVNFSKWDRGIAILETLRKNGRKGRIRIDDYKFSGASDILVRIREVRPEIESGAWPELNRKNRGEGASN